MVNHAFVLESYVYATKLRTLGELKNARRENIQEIGEELWESGS